ncbi:MAG: biotin/lipoyl-containing protein, partial [Verrucomicrobiales bacterium]
TLIIRFLHQTDPNSDGERTLIFELNGVARHVKILDTSIRTEKKSRPKADEKDDAQVGAPMPGLVASLAVSVGSKVSEGDALLTLEAMKMFTTITAPKDGTGADLLADSGETVDRGDLFRTLS